MNGMTSVKCYGTPNLHVHYLQDIHHICCLSDDDAFLVGGIEIGRNGWTFDNIVLSVLLFYLFESQIDYQVKVQFDKVSLIVLLQKQKHTNKQKSNPGKDNILLGYFKGYYLFCRISFLFMCLCLNTIRETLSHSPFTRLSIYDTNK